MTEIISCLIVISFSLIALAGSWFYFRHYRLSRAPIGVFNRQDVLVTFGFIVIVPFLYIALPGWLATGIFSLSTFGLLYFALEPIMVKRLKIWLITALLVGGELGTYLVWGGGSEAFWLINNLVIVISIIGLSNMWVQSGMRASDVTLMACLLVIYDFLATAQSSVMSEVFAKLSTGPFAPVIGWQLGQSGGIGIGLGDILLLTLYPIVIRKAYSHRAGMVALIVGGVVLVSMFLLPLKGVFPAMVVLGPLMLLQYLYYSRRYKNERTTWLYLQQESPVQPVTDPSSRLF